MLLRALRSIRAQDFSKVGFVEVVVSDHSTDSEIEDACRRFRGNPSLEVRYFRKGWDTRSPSSNLNYAFQVSRGEIIKILFLDDFLIDRSSLEKVSEVFDDEDVSWVVTGTIHTRDGSNFFRPHIPYFHDEIHFGINTISSPSVVTLRRQCWQPFDEALFWLMDVDFYKRMSIVWGRPQVLREILIATGIGLHQATHSIVKWPDKVKEHALVLKKYHSLREIPVVVGRRTVREILRLARAIKQKIRKNWLGARRTTSEGYRR